jgi:hypothetical protein
METIEKKSKDIMDKLLIIFDGNEDNTIIIQI